MENSNGMAVLKVEGMDVRVVMDFLKEYNKVTSPIEPEEADTEKKVTGKNKVYLRNTHRYGFRPGECAEILGVVSFTPDGSDARACYHIEYADGIKDHVAIDDSGYYELEMMI